MDDLFGSDAEEETKKGIQSEEAKETNKAEEMDELFGSDADDSGDEKLKPKDVKETNDSAEMDEIFGSDAEGGNKSESDMKFMCCPLVSIYACVDNDV